MRLSITTDELSLDLASALEVLHEQQCREFELRALGLETVPDVDERWLAQADKAVLKRLRVSALAPRYFLDAAPSAQSVEKIVGIAKRLKCGLISIYSPKKPADAPEPDEDADEEAVVLPPEETLEAMRGFAASAAREGLNAALRTHPETYAGTALEALALLEALNAGCGSVTATGLDWDVANCFAAGDDSGLEHLPDVLPHLKIVRMRDAIRRGMGADWASLGKGVIPWEDILEQLYAGGYRGPVVLEPGVAPKLKEGRAALALAARWIGACRMNARGAGKNPAEDDRV